MHSLAAQSIHDHHHLVINSSLIDYDHAPLCESSVASFLVRLDCHQEARIQPMRIVSVLLSLSDWHYDAMSPADLYKT